MSLGSALVSAISGLQATQGQLRVTSNNVSNANTEGYTRKVAAPTTRVVDARADGVELSGLRREIDAYLTREAQRAQGALAGLEVRAEFHQRMQDLFGRPEDDASLAARLTDLATALQRLADTPESPTERNQAVAAARDLARAFNGATDDIQAMRLEADRRIGEAVAAVNGELEKIAGLNDRIGRAQAAGEPTAELADQRDRALARLRELIEVRTFERPTGETAIYTPDGRLLVDQTAASLAFTPAQGLAAGTSGGAVTLDGTSLAAQGGGELGVLLELRDGRLPDLQAEIDALAAETRDGLNAVHNTGSGRPPAGTLTGSRAFADPTAGVIDTAGRLRIALVAADGTVAETAEVDFDALADGASLNQVRDHINAAFAGAPASVTADGRLRLAAPAGQGVVLASLEPPATASLSAGPGESTGLSHFFGLNDLLTSGDLVAGEAATGVAGRLAVRADIAADPSRVARGALSGAAGLAAGDVAVAPGDASVARALAAAFDARRSFPAAGGLPGIDATLAGYAGEVLAANADAAARVDADKAFQESLARELGFRAESRSGVNIDEEMANMVTLQQAYAASARVVSTVQRMFDVLTGMTR